MTISGPEGSLVDVSFRNTNLMIARLQINLGEEACTMQAVHQVFDEREGVPVLDRDLVQDPIVDAES